MQMMRNGNNKGVYHFLKQVKGANKMFRQVDGGDEEITIAASLIRL